MIRHWCGHSDFSKCHFAVPQGLKVLEIIPRALLDSDFLLVVLPTANYFEDFGCQIVSVFLDPKNEFYKWIGPAAAQSWCVQLSKKEAKENH